MRSSVSYMLSHGSGDPIMSHPDYEQEAHHHGALLILVRGIGHAKPRSLQRVFERIQRVNNVRIHDAGGAGGGQTRDIWVRFVRDHPIENNEWGDFQTHRRLLGLITVGAFETQTELSELCRVHESLKVKYHGTLYDSRCFAFGPTHVYPRPVLVDGDPGYIGETATEEKKPPPDVISCSSSTTDYEKQSQQSDSISTASSVKTNGHENQSVTDSSSTVTTAKGDGGGEEPSLGIPMTSKLLEETFHPPSNFKSTAYFYPENDACSNLEANINEFISSLFWILESKRLERTREKIDKVSLLLAPFEKKDFVGLDMESRNNKKRCMGRVTKHLADLTLQAGLVAESLSLFHTASETLRAISDSLWLGAAFEGLCAASAILLFPRTRHNDNSPELTRRRSSGRRIIDGGGGAVELLRSSSMSTSSSISSTSSVTSTVSSSSNTTAPTTTATNSSSVEKPSRAASPSDVQVDVRELPANILRPEQITSHYRDAIINYSKYRHAGVIETEAALKAARICIEQKNNLDVAMFLQNVLYINLNMSELERVQRFETLTELYQTIGYHRKAAFCQRLAAWRHVAQSNQNPDWAQNYRLLLESFSGHRLSLDPIEVLKTSSGWPCLQVDLLQQLVFAAKRLGHYALATRHMTFLLQTMWDHLTPVEQREMAQQLQNLSHQCEGSPVPLHLENGTVIPAANLTDLPFCSMFQVKELSSHLRPHKIERRAAVDQGPFLFTPMHFNSMERRRKDEERDAKDTGKVPFEWIQNDMCEVTLKVTNPLPHDVQLCDVRLLTTGVVFESIPQTVTLPSKLPTYVTLHGSPIECGGMLHIEGYSTHTLGVKSDCRLRNMLGRGLPAAFHVNVLPAMPKLKLQTSLPQTATFSGGLTSGSGAAGSENIVTTASVTLFNGERTECVITVTNCSNVPIEYLEGTVVLSTATGQSSTASQDPGHRRMFQWDNDAVKEQLPILPHESKQFTLHVYGEADFLGPVTTGGGGVGPDTGPSSLPIQVMSGSSFNAANSGQTSLHSRFSSPNNTMRRNEMATSSFRSGNTIHSGHSSLATTMSLNTATSAPRQVEAQLRLRYSGGAGLKAGQCRQCTVALNVELLPSAQVTNWDVLPAEVASEFYLVLDVVNLTPQEMILQYTDNKNILVEARESCRVPVPVSRCPLEKIRAAAVEEATAGMLAESGGGGTGSLFSGGVGSEATVDVTERVCSAHIAELVKLKWTLSGTENTGCASLRGITLSPTMMDLVTVAPLMWEVFSDDVAVPPQGEINCITGQCIKVGVTICNTSSAPLHQLTLSIRFYQDHLNGVHNYMMETRISTSGPNEYHIPILHPSEKASHEISVLFFTAGRYKSDIQCRSLMTSAGVIQGAAGGVMSPQPPVMIRTTNTMMMMMGQGTGGADVTGASTHTWRFIPSVEITVVE